MSESDVPDWRHEMVVNPPLTRMAVSETPDIVFYVEPDDTPNWRHDLVAAINESQPEALRSALQSFSGGPAEFKVGDAVTVTPIDVGDTRIYLVQHDDESAAPPA